MNLARCALLLLAAFLLLATSRPVCGQGLDFLTAADGDWSIDFELDEPTVVDDEFDFVFPSYSGLTGWRSFNDSSEPALFRSHLYREWFFFRTENGEFSDREHPLESLTLNELSNVNPTTGLEQENVIYVSFGEHGVDPIGVSVVFELQETAPGGRGATIRETIRVENFLDSSQTVQLFAYTDLDMDNSAGFDTAFHADNRTLRQQSFIGSTVDVHVAWGPTPSAFDIQPFSTLEDALDDDLPTDLGNNTFVGPGDATHAFQWGLNLAAHGLDAGDSETIVLDKIGDFVELKLPEIGEDGRFLFDETDPATTGLPPIWYDPVVSTGYEYEVQAGDNAFAEVYLPAGFEDGEYFLEVLDSTHGRFGELISVSGNGVDASFDFTAGGNNGAAAFRVTGIEIDAFVDPTDPLGFPTGLTFVSGNQVMFAQSALTVSIPEPAALGLALWAPFVVPWRRGRARCA